MERIDTSFTFGCVFVDALCDPLGSIAGNDFDRRQLFRCQAAIELFQYSFSMTFCSPYDGVRIMFYNNGDIFVALFIASLVDADIDQPIESSGALGSISFSVREIHLPTVAQSIRM